MGHLENFSPASEVTGSFCGSRKRQSWEGRYKWSLKCLVQAGLPFLKAPRTVLPPLSSLIHAAWQGPASGISATALLPTAWFYPPGNGEVPRLCRLTQQGEILS